MPSAGFGSARWPRHFEELAGDPPETGLDVLLSRHPSEIGPYLPKISSALSNLKSAHSR